MGVDLPAALDTFVSTAESLFAGPCRSGEEEDAVEELQSAGDFGSAILASFGERYARNACGTGMLLLRLRLSQ